MPAGSTPPLPTYEDVEVVRGDAPTDGGWEHPPTPPTTRTVVPAAVLWHLASMQ